MKQTVLGALLLVLSSFHARAVPVDAAPIQISVLRGLVHVGERQVVVVRGGLTVPRDLYVIMPDGETLALTQRPQQSALSLRWTFTQPPGTITHGSRRALVRLVTRGRTYVTHYSIAFGGVDITAPHSPVLENTKVTLWIHTAPHVVVHVQIETPRTTTRGRVRTGLNGWVPVHTRVENAGFPFRPITVTLVAVAFSHHHRSVARADFQVLPFRFGVHLANIVVLHQVAGGWVPASNVEVGELIRVQGSGYITEPAGNMPQCVSGYITVVQDATRIQMAPLHCLEGTSNGVVADLTLSTDLKPGPAQIEVDASYINGSAHIVVPISVTVHAL
ncbi:MAG: hypothetical protein NVSMB52_02290 [Chloroflexota bacterium]